MRTTSFNDAKNTTKDSVLIGPPSLEFAPYPRVPLGKRRNDARQGLIDQDSEFQTFLESLTSPAPKPTPVEVDGRGVDGAEKKEVTTTPLIEHLREKKAAKEKAAKEKAASGGKGSGKHARQESKDDKSNEKGDGKKASAKALREAAASPDKGRKLTKAERAAKDAVKVLNKEVTGSVAAAAAPTAPAQTAAPPQKPTSERKRERGIASIAAKMLLLLIQEISRKTTGQPAPSGEHTRPLSQRRRTTRLLLQERRRRS